MTGLDRPPPGSGGLYGRRTGRKLHTTQSALMTELLPRIEIDPSKPVSMADLVPGSKELRMEIGFGGGEHLADNAARRPGTAFIGCEPFRNGVAKFLEEVEARALQNVRVWTGDAGVLVERLPPACLAGVDLFYPDPWPKRRQRKRRFVSDEILMRLARVTVEGAALRFATDIDDYAGWTLARIHRSRHFSWEATRAEDWRRPWPDWPSTRYEAKAFREGRRPVYLTFIRTKQPV